ncbi:hypothetical protein [Roseisalinus antarcticus]|uniref:hypothetical protein n=1 Tax=Roseisalinus antarcticus TaxID=254357 RepID=UPI00117B0A1B|nr:hypothetical protein [Roseisalinus antarcticus]
MASIWRFHQTIGAANNYQRTPSAIRNENIPLSCRRFWSGPGREPKPLFSPSRPLQKKSVLSGRAQEIREFIDFEKIEESNNIFRLAFPDLDQMRNATFHPKIGAKELEKHAFGGLVEAGLAIVNGALLAGHNGFVVQAAFRRRLCEIAIGSTSETFLIMSAKLFFGAFQSDA